MNRFPATTYGLILTLGVALQAAGPNPADSHTAPASTTVPTPAPSGELNEPSNISPVLLPTVVVDAKKEVVPSETDVLTKAGLSDVYRKAYPGASMKGQDPTDSSLRNYAQLMHQDDVRLTQRATFTRLESTLGRSGDSAGAKSLKAEINRTFIRRPDFKTEGMDRTVNHWRR